MVLPAPCLRPCNMCISKPHLQSHPNPHLQVVLAEDLVPGDIVLLKSGDKVPADVRLVATTNLQVGVRVQVGVWVANTHAARAGTRCPQTCGWWQPPTCRCECGSLRACGLLRHMLHGDKVPADMRLVATTNLQVGV